MLEKHRKDLKPVGRRKSTRTDRFGAGSASADTNPSKKRKRKKAVAGENMIKVKKEPTTGSDVHTEVSAILAKFVDIVFVNGQNLLFKSPDFFSVHPFRLSNVTNEKKSKLIIDLIEKKDPETVEQIHGWFVGEGYIDEKELSEDENETQLNEFLNPKPGSRYWEPKWPKGIVAFIRITVPTIVLHGFCV